ncbi:MAG: hypothetical protein ACLQAH_07490 [Limisphaerales bacterium]
MMPTPEPVTPGSAPAPEPPPASVTLAESKRLIELEKIIEAGRQTFVAVGTALAEIRDARLYKVHFSTFEDYCVGKWGFKRAHAHRLIQAASIAKDLSPIGDIKTESQARELAKVPKDQREAVIKVAITTAKTAGKPITAKDIQIAASPAPGTEPDFRRRFPAAMKGSKAAWKWWYNTTSPEKRGAFFGMILASNKPVEVQDKKTFTKKVEQWLAENVTETGGRHE